MPDDFEKKEVVHATKRCPECFTYVKLDVKKCPDWHNAKGGKAWLFVDEISVE